MIMKNHHKIITALLLALPLLINQAIAQPPPPTGPPCWPPPCVPVDGGISYFVIAGILMGSITLYFSNKKRLAEEKAR